MFLPVQFWFFPEETLDFLNATVLPRLLARANDATNGTSNSTSNGTRGVAGAPPTGTVQARHGAVEGAAALTEVMKETDHWMGKLHDTLRLG